MKKIKVLLSIIVLISIFTISEVNAAVPEEVSNRNRRRL